MADPPPGPAPGPAPDPPPGAAAAFAPPADARVFLGRLTHLDPHAVVRLRPAGAGRTALWGRLPWGVLVTREVPGAAPGADVTVGAAALLAAGSPAGAGSLPAAGSAAGVGSGPGAAHGAGGTLPLRRDAEWRSPLPPDPGVVVEEVPAHRVAEVAAAAAGTLREVAETGLAGRPVGVRVLREALLDHVAIVVAAEPARVAPGSVPEVIPGVLADVPDRVEIPQRLVQAVVRMGFLGPAEEPADEPGGVPVGEPAGVPAGVPVAEPVRVRWSQRWVGLAARYGTAWLPPPSPLAVRPARPERGSAG